jgi:hypothetical protein
MSRIMMKEKDEAQESVSQSAKTIELPSFSAAAASCVYGFAFFLRGGISMCATVLSVPVCHLPRTAHSDASRLARNRPFFRATEGPRGHCSRVSFVRSLGCAIIRTTHTHKTRYTVVLLLCDER